MPKGIYVRTTKGKKALSKAAKRKWKDPKYRRRYSEEISPKRMTPEVRYKIGSGNRGGLSPKLRQKVAVANRHPKKREKLRQARLRQRFPKKNTDIENILRMGFVRRRLHFFMHQPMFSRFICDFVFPHIKLIIEADGEYWHRTKDHSPLYDAARSLGWQVWRFSGSLIKQRRQTLCDLVAFVAKQTSNPSPTTYPTPRSKCSHTRPTRTRRIRRDNPQASECRCNIPRPSTSSPSWSS